MTLPFPLPDWLPWWVPLAVLVPALLYLLVFLLMPFSVFGLKTRLEQIEARLEELQLELRMSAYRPPEPSRYAGKEEAPEFGRASQRPAEPPPPPVLPARRLTPQDAPQRIEPRLGWPGP